MNHDWVYRGVEGPDENYQVCHYWICSNCDSIAKNWLDNTPPKPEGLSVSRDRIRMLTCDQKMVERIQDN